MGGIIQSTTALLEFHGKKFGILIRSGGRRSEMASLRFEVVALESKFGF